MKKSLNTLTIPPQGKRKHKIIFKATFSNDKNTNKELEKEVAIQLWKSWIFS